MRVYITPTPETIQDDNGIGRIVHAQFKHLPSFGVELVRDVEKADIVAAHVSADELPRLDASHIHGCYWSGDANSGTYHSWHHTANRQIAAAVRRARAITVPSPWVSEVFKRDMRIAPRVIGHGIDFDAWNIGTNQGYVLWNKNRAGDVCDPTPAYELAKHGVSVISTFAPLHEVKPYPSNLNLIGTVSHDEMRPIIQNADVYLATTKETFGIGTLEAMAAGVPILGYAHGGTADLVKHKVTGWLARKDDINGLLEGLNWLRANRQMVSQAARQFASQYDWPLVIGQYADLYRETLEGAKQERHGVTVVITSFNYAEYLGQAIESVLAQTYKADEIIVVDDGSTDDTSEVASRYPVRLIRQENRGVAAARNAGIAAARSPYIICLDADDMLDRLYIQTLLPAFVKDRGLGIAYVSMTLFDGTGYSKFVQWPEFDWDIQSKVSNPPATCIPSASMFRRSMWERAGGYQQVWAPGEDTEFWLRGLSVGFTAKKVSDAPLFLYRAHLDSASRTKKYRRIDDWHPWMRDKQYPLAAPAKQAPIVRSYSEPVVSVVIPVGPGHGRYLPSALDSLLGQTFREWEVIVVNDSGEPLQLTPYPFARVLETKGREGAGKARNLGLQVAKGPLCVFLDADDYLVPSALSEMLNAFWQNNGKYVYSDWFAINGNRVVQDQAPEYDQHEWFYKGLHAVTVLMSTEQARQVGGFDETIAGWEDWDLFCKLAVNGICGVRLPKPLLGYRQHSGQRRESSLSKSTELLDALRARYGAYATGERQVMACCGGNGGAIIAAKQSMGMVPQEPTERSLAGVVPPTPDMWRLEYIGQNQGSIAFRVNGRRYTGGNNQFDRYIDAPPEDAVELLKQIDRWRRVVVQTSVMPQQMERTPAPETVLATEPRLEVAPVAKEETQTAPEPVLETVGAVVEVAQEQVRRGRKPKTSVA